MRIVVEAMRSVIAHLKEIGGFDRPRALSRENFRGELCRLGLLGNRFGVWDYLTACEAALGIRIVVEEVPDLGQTWGEDFAAAGHLAELIYDGERQTATILVRKSLRRLPWPTYEMSLYHELSHLMARHFLKVRAPKRPNRVVGGAPTAEPRGPGPDGGQTAEDPQELQMEVFEPEARTRARWLLLAGTFPEAFVAAGTDRLP